MNHRPMNTNVLDRTECGLDEHSPRARELRRDRLQHVVLLVKDVRQQLKHIVGGYGDGPAGRMDEWSKNQLRAAIRNLEVVR